MELFTTPLGEMKIVEHYLFYDRPFIFLCEDKVSNKFVVHLVDDDERSEKWFFVPTSNLRVEAVRTGRISLRDSIINAETGVIWEVTTPFDGSEGSALIRNCSSLTETDLPGPNAVLSLPDNRLPKKNIDAKKEADQLYRDVLFLYLNDGEHSQLINADHLGLILLRSQGLLHSLIDTDGSSKGRISKSTKEKATMYYAGDFAASVGIKLEAKSNELFDSPIQSALELFIDLLDASTDKELLINLLSNVQKRSIARYRFLLQSLLQANVSIKAEWGSPKKGIKVASLTLDQINHAIDIMDLEGEDVTQKIKLVGDLVGLLTDNEKKRYTFEFINMDGERYKGILQCSGKKYIS
ncbi:MAG: DUF6575 domain-containing protein [Thermotaleaceae bacterium]